VRIVTPPSVTTYKEYQLWRWGSATLRNRVASKVRIAVVGHRRNRPVAPAANASRIVVSLKAFMLNLDTRRGLPVHVASSIPVAAAVLNDRATRRRLPSGEWRQQVHSRRSFHAFA